jgi:cyclopropane fatty-acyl-phospholipid synthase-like methyltransferase
MSLFGGPLEAMLPLVAAEVAGLDRVLEVAAGTGLVTRALAPEVGAVVATDYAAAMVARLEKRVRDDGLDNVEVRQLDLLDLDGSDRFDAVVAANVLHLLPDLDAALTAMVRSLEPGGRLIVPTFCHDETARSRVASSLLGLAGFPGQRRLTLVRLVEVLDAQGLRPRRAVLLPGLLPIGFVSAARA